MFTLALAWTLALLALWILILNRPRRAPPGPWSLPIIGHLLFLGKFPHKTLLKWSKRYGPVISVQLGSLSTIVISDAHLIRKAFNLAGVSGRAPMKPFEEAAGERGIGTAPYPSAREQRQFMTRYLKDFGAHGKAMELRTLAEVDSLLSYIKTVENQPVPVTDFYYRNIINALASILWGKRFEPHDPTAVEFAELIRGTSNIDGMLEILGFFIPKLSKWFPNFFGHTKRVQGLRKIQAFLSKLIKEHESSRVEGEPRDLTDAYLDKIAATTDAASSFHPDAGNIVPTLRDMVLAATDTTSNSLEWATYYLTRDPQVQAKVQAEIDAVIGFERLPSLSDRAHMVYTEATIAELLRMSSVIPLGILHQTTENETIGDYVIPKNTAVMSNIYAVHYDPDVWGDPENFRPTRWIDPEGKLKKVDELVSFSAGKRSCIGESLARIQLFLYITRILQCFDVRAVGKLPSEDGFGITLAPQHFQVKFVRRTTTGFKTTGNSRALESMLST